MDFSSRSAPKFENSIIAFSYNNNCSGCLLSDYDRKIDSQGANTCSVADDLVGANSLLLPLRNNGDYVHMHLVGIGSPAIDNGEDNGYLCLGYAERNFPRPIYCDQNGYPDSAIGAVEAGKALFLLLIMR